MDTSVLVAEAEEGITEGKQRTDREKERKEDLYRRSPTLSPYLFRSASPALAAYLSKHRALETPHSIASQHGIMARMVGILFGCLSQWHC